MRINDQRMMEPEVGLLSGGPKKRVPRALDLVITGLMWVIGWTVCMVGLGVFARLGWELVAVGWGVLGK